MDEKLVKVIKENITRREHRIATMTANGATESELAEEYKVLNIHKNSLQKALIGEYEFKPID